MKPASSVSSVTVTAVAARSLDRAQAFATRYGIARAYAGYEELPADPEIDAVYNPLPNGLHGRWTKAALSAGKHVLCKKPFTANAAEAREMRAGPRWTRVATRSTWRGCSAERRLRWCLRRRNCGRLRWTGR
nr:Gfo/Idh/MocA family oxidoreductase [Amycolatopsis sp. CA-128772]